MQTQKDLCRVCGLKAHGFHFGVLSCRACAAFFRRFVVLNLKYNCLKDDKRCKVDGSVRGICRQCRFEKCIGLGMTPDNVQLNRDSYKNREILKKKQESDSDSCCSDKQSTSGVSSIVSDSKSGFEEDLLFKEFEKLHETIHTTLDYYSPSYPTEGLPLLNKLSMGLQEMRKNVRMQSNMIRQNLTKLDLFRSWTDQFSRLSKWMYHCENLRRLSSDMKHILLRRSWFLLSRFERLHLSITLFKSECLQTMCFYSTNDEIIDLRNVTVEGQRLTEGNRKTNLETVVNFMFIIGKMLLEFMPTNEEFIFMMAQLMFLNEDLPKSLHETGEEVLNELADNLHEFYAKHNVQNYAIRILKIMNIIKTAKKLAVDINCKLPSEFIFVMLNSKSEEFKC